MDENPTPMAEIVAVEDNSPQPSPVAEPTTSTTTQEPVAEPTQTETAPAAEPQEQVVERQPSRAERRIQQLTGQLKEFTAAQQASAPIPTLTPQAPRISDLLQGQESVDPAELDRLVERREQAVRGMNALEVQQLRHELTQQRAVDEIEKEASILPTQYEELNPDSPRFNPILEQKIEAAYKQRAVITNPYNPNMKMVDPSVRLSDVARDFIEVARAAAQQGSAQTNAALAQQVDNSAITPTTGAPSEKSFDDMSLAEQEAYLRAKGYNI